MYQFAAEKGLIFWLSVCIIAILVWQLLDRIEAESERLEAVMVITVLAELRELMVVKTAEKLAQNRMGDLKKFVNTNPMKWLEVQPLNYSESNLEKNKQEVDLPGHWYFNDDSGELVYQVRNSSALITDGEPGRLRFRVQLNFLDRNGNGHWDAGQDRVLGLRLESLQSFKWSVLNWRGMSSVTPPVEPGQN
ncbi:MSHA pilin protein MshA [Oleiphilus messinensis]|uniref:MSHA pilin protein MshA n=1 Tax=Oleiphilus messinensis TaxID=141451 RepID=A0A1Y0I2Y4_9GAMM|nr:hypothetical protein [Oleiphilus messinensis]ARU54817.1 MSHA pilin protein MshA [Oleiphilus messinensis]